ncbi:MAG: hypothetical protein GY790_15230 [Bacteroidetes bacterium]|nr:hypothetical protein [Bacteroidota bacterium]
MKSISGYIFNGVLLLWLLPSLNGQDTLRTYGPRFGVNLASAVGYFLSPPVFSGEASLDFEIFPDFYPIFELGYSTMNDSVDDVSYSSGGPFARVGVDYNLLDTKDRSVHHAFTVGFRYGTSVFKQSAANITVPSEYWGDHTIESYENTLNAHWFELLGGITAEVAQNLFFGWTVRFKILLNPDMDPQIAPLLIPGYGNGTNNRGFGFSYSIMYKIPLLKK